MFNLTNILYLDFAVGGQIGFQDAGTAIMQGIINLHHHIFFLLIIKFFKFLFIEYS